MYPAKQRNTYQHKLHQRTVIHVGARTPIDAKEKMPIQSGPKTTPVHTEHKIPIQPGPKTTPVNAKHKIPIQSGPKAYDTLATRARSTISRHPLGSRFLKSFNTMRRFLDTSIPTPQDASSTPRTIIPHPQINEISRYLVSHNTPRFLTVPSS